MACTLYELQPEQTVRINGSVHIVKAMIEFRQGSFWWKEYTLKQAIDGALVSLSVERDETVPVCALFRSVETCFSAGAAVVHEGRKYSLRESGLAEVRGFFGDTNARVGDIVEFSDYHEKTGLLLSREQWPDRTEYSAGVELPKGKIAGLGQEAREEQPPADAPAFSREIYEEMSRLFQGQKVQIRDKTYTVTSRVRYRQGAFSWVEYELEPSVGSRVWLSVERGGEGGNACLMSLHQPIPYSGVQWEGRDALYAGVVYRYAESGAANVDEFEGGDYDYNESFTFTEYRSENNKLLTQELWEDENEASVGEELDVSALRVLEPHRTAPKRKRRWFPVAVLLSFVAVIFFLPFTFSSRPTIATRLASNPSFQHVTAVTLPDGKKAQVYATSLSPDEACRAVIGMDPEYVQYVTTAAGDMGERMVQTSRETAMIYVSEDGKTLVQVNARNTRSKGGYTAYRPRSSIRLLDLYRNSQNWFDAGRRRSVSEIQAFPMDTKGYDSLIASARQASVSARRSSGGGRSFGK